MIEPRPHALARILLRGLYWVLPMVVYCYAVALAPRVVGADLLPTPDAEEYALLANRLAAFQPPLIGVGLNDYPSRYSLAFPLLLAPFAWLFRFDISRDLWASAFFGLLATGLIAWAGSWLLGSRRAGGLAALFWALHPYTVASANLNMSETALTMMFFAMLALARPWLDRARPAGGTGRAVALGLVLGWLTVCKAPYVYWAGAMAWLLAVDAVTRGRRAPLVGFAAAGLACALADAWYRRWAFGAWDMNGYAHWFPEVYSNFSLTFNWKYLTEPWDVLHPKGNIKYYANMALGFTHDFYSPYMGATLVAAIPCVLWPWRHGRPRRLVVALMAGWAVAGAVFCGLYFFQSIRFLYLWIPLADLLAAWLLMHAWSWRPLRRGAWGRRYRLHAWVQVLAIFVALILARGEYRRVRAIHHLSPDHAKTPKVEIIRPMLESVPQGAWLMTNYEPPVVELYRPHPGPTGALYSFIHDRWINGHIFQIYHLSMKPRRPRPEARRWLQSVPAPWKTGPTLLIDPSNQWILDARQRRELFRRPVYALVVVPPELPTRQYLDEVVFPMLKREVRLQTIHSRENVTLYKMEGLEQAIDEP